MLRTLLAAGALAALALVPARAGQKPDPLQTHYDAARTFQLAGDYPRAASEYRIMLGLALDRLGNLRANQRDFRGAEELFAAALKLHPENPELHVDLSILKLRQHQLAEARSEAETALKLAPENGRAHRLLGAVLLAQGNTKEAIPHLEKAVVLAPDFDAGYTLGAAYLKAKDTARVRLLFDEMLAGMGALPQLHMMFGYAYRMAGYYEEALAEFKKAVELGPRLPKAHYLLALGYLLRYESDGYPQAKAEFEEELKISPGDFYSHYLLGFILLQSRDNAAAEKHLLAAAQTDPTSPDPLLLLGQIYVDTNRPAEAEQVLRQAILLERDPSRNDYAISRAHYLLGRILAATGKHAEAEKELREYQRQRTVALSEAREATDDQQNRPVKSVVKEQEADQLVVAEDMVPPKPADKAASDYAGQLSSAAGDAYNNLGVMAAQRHDLAAALDFFRNAARWTPGLETLARNWGMAAFLAGKYDEAIPPLEKHLAQHPDDERARGRLGLSYFIAENYSQAARTLKPLEAKVAEDPGLSYAYGVSLIKTGENQRGIELLKTIDSSSPTSPEVHFLLGQAYADQGDVNQALEEYRKALQLNPGLKQVHYYAGLTLLKKARLAEAAQEFRAELAGNPADVSAKYHLAYALISDQHTEEAASLLREVIRDDPNHADAHYQIGKLMLEQGDTKSAIANLETGVRLGPERDYIHYQLSIAYRRDSRLADAEREMKTYQTLKQKTRGRHEPR